MDMPSNKSIEILWIQTLQPFYPTVTFVLGAEYLNENRPRPDKPYVIVSILNGPDFRGEDELRESDITPGDFKVQNIVYYTISLQAIGTESNSILSSINHTIYTKYFDINGNANLAQAISDIEMAVHSRNDILDLSEQLNTGFERRSVLEIAFSLVYESTTIEDGSTIDSATYSGDIDGRILPTTKVKP